MCAVSFDLGGKSFKGKGGEEGEEKRRKQRVKAGRSAIRISILEKKKVQTSNPTTKKTSNQTIDILSRSVPGPRDKEPPEGYNAVDVALIKFNAV